MALASDGPTDVKIDLKLGQQIGCVEGRKHQTQFLTNWYGIVNRFLPITLLIVFRVSLGVLKFSNNDFV